jgi:histidyl-tRNA synthetase
MAEKIIAAVKGTRDFYPQEQFWQNWLYETAKKVSQSFGYQEYDGPILESLSLYAAKSSEEIVNKQSFVIPSRSKKNREKLVLRPELTPTLARMVASKEYQLNLPLRWWSWGSFFRYEAPQKGRGREFYQWNLDFLGQDSPYADAEVIAVGINFLVSLGLSAQDVVIKINDRQLLDQAFAGIDLEPKQKLPLFRLLDKRAKISSPTFLSGLIDLGLTGPQIKTLESLLKEGGYDQSPWLRQIFATLANLGLAKWLEFDPGLVRGFDYYTNTVFEAQMRQERARSLFGGGRYQNLVADVGGKRKIGGVGLAAGDMMLLAVLNDKGLLPKESILSAPILLVSLDEESLTASLALATKLREAGFNVESFLDYSLPLAKQLSYANKKGFARVLIIGSEEQAEGRVTIKDLVSGRQKKVKQIRLVKELAALAKPSLSRIQKL